MTNRIMRLWLKRRPKLDHDYALAGFLLAVNPDIMALAAENRTDAHDDAVRRLLSKLFLDPMLVGNARVVARANLVHNFWDDYSNFTLRTGKFEDPDIWVIAARPDQAAHLWHKVYSLNRSHVLGKLACIVLSKGLGMGSAERHWKLIKAVKSGTRASTGTVKCKQQGLVYGASQQQKARSRETKLSIAGKLWCDEDFAGCKMDLFCEEIINSVTATDAVVERRIFRAWREGWEKEKLGPNGNTILHARLVKKYGGLQWLDPDNGFRLNVGHPNQMSFFRKRGDNQYYVFGMLEGYDINKTPEEQEDCYEPWDQAIDDFYEQVVDFYKGKTEVTCYLKGGECDSESDNE
jgi:hypothetical protein